MKHLSEEQLVMHYYGEDRQRDAVEEHLGDCAACRAVYEALERQLGGLELPVPERGEAYGQQVWQRLRPRLETRARAWWPWQRWALASGMAVLVVGAFLAGRHWPARTAPQPLAEPVRERVLLATVGGHLERTEMVLVELLNARANGGVDISNEQARAQDLLASSRLYRQAAARSGRTAVASILDEIERVLLEVIHGPARLAPEELEALRRRIENEDLLFRVRITGAGLRRAEKIPRGSS